MLLQNRFLSIILGGTKARCQLVPTIEIKMHLDAGSSTSSTYFQGYGIHTDPGFKKNRCNWCKTIGFMWLTVESSESHSTPSVSLCGDRGEGDVEVEVSLTPRIVSCVHHEMNICYDV